MGALGKPISYNAKNEIRHDQRAETLGLSCIFIVIGSTEEVTALGSCQSHLKSHEDINSQLKGTCAIRLASATVVS